MIHSRAPGSARFGQSRDVEDPGLGAGQHGNSGGERERFGVRTGVCSNKQAICVASVDARTRIQVRSMLLKCVGRAFSDSEKFHDSEKAGCPRA